jgi:hypothetical protein
MKTKGIKNQQKLGLLRRVHPLIPEGSKTARLLQGATNKFSPGVELGAVIEGAGVVHGEHVTRLGLCGAAIRYGHCLHFEFLFAGADVRN